MATIAQTNVALLTQDPNANTDSAILNLAGGGATSQRPGNPPLWFHYYDLDLGRDVIWNGTDWIVTINGPQGFQGPQGPQGAQGFQGYQGNAGPQGFQGVQGPQGSATPMNSGPTAGRPGSPGPFERYFDTDINAQIWYERGQWRTVEGVQGDVKFVTAANDAAALVKNPGWSLLGDTVLGRVPVFAGQGAGGLTNRVALTGFGAEGHVLSNEESRNHTHVFGRSVTNNNDDFLFRTGSGPAFPNGQGQQINGEIGAAVFKDLGTAAGAHFITNNKEPGSDPDPHSSMQPSFALIGLQKA
jgi:hypothetical protein